MRRLLIGCAAMGLAINRPYAMNAATITFYFYVLSPEYLQALCSSI